MKRSTIVPRHAGPLARLLALALALALACAAGCSLPAWLPSGDAAGGAVEVVPSLSEGSYQVQSVVAKYTAANVKHVVVKLFKVVSSTETLAAQEMDVAKADLGRTIRFRYLNFNSKYRVRGYAYKADGTATADLISKDAYADVDVGTGDRPALARLSIQLGDVPFGGAGTGSIDIKTGTVVDGSTISVVVP